MKNLNIFFTLILFSQLSFAQDRIVRGVVNDSTGLPIPGVHILIEGTKKYTETNFDGNYAIKINSGQFLVFSYVGMNPRRISADQNEIDVILQMTSTIYDLVPPDAVTRNKKSLYNAITRISAEDVKNAK